MSAICFNNVLKTKPQEQLENAATKAKDELAKAQKVLDEYKNKDLSDEKRQLNDKLARLDELNLYVGRVDKNSPNDATIARLEARYGKKYQEIVDIVREKIDKENADEVLDISFAPKRNADEVITKIQEKFKFGEKKAKDLFEWHKDSSPLTKNDDGTPKVFYHGSGNEFEIFDMSKSNNGWGFWFANNFGMASEYDNLGKGKIYEVFINTKKPFNLLDESVSKNDIKRIFGDDLMNEIYDRKGYFKNYDTWEKEDIVELRAMLMPDGLDNYMDALNAKKLKWGEKIRQKLQAAGYDSIIGSKDNPRKYIVVFNPNQIKSIDNTGSWTDSAGKIIKEKPSDESARHSYFNAQSPNILHSNEIWGGGLAGGTLNGLETDEDGNIIGFNPAKFVAGFIAGAAGTKAVKSLFEIPKFKASAQKFAMIQRIKAKRENTMKYNTFKKIDESQKYGSKMKLIGAENLNADIIAYALSKNKRFAVNKLDEQTAKALNFKYPNDVRRTIQPDEVIHTLKRHGENSNLVKFSGQKPVTLDDIAKYQHYADNAKDKGLSFDKQGNEILVSFKRLDNDFYVVVEQIRKSQNELSFKDLYFGTGEFDESKLGKKISLPASS